MTVNQQKADTGAEVVRKRPDQASNDHLDENVATDCSKGFRCGEAGTKQPDDQRQHQEQTRAANPVKNRYLAAPRQFDRGEVQVFWTLLLDGHFCHERHPSRVRSAVFRFYVV